MLQVEHSLELRQNRAMIGDGYEDRFIKNKQLYIGRELKPVTETSSKVDLLASVQFNSIVHKAIFVRIVELFLIFELVFLEVTTTVCLQYCQDTYLKISSQVCNYELLEAVCCMLNTQLKLEAARLSLPLATLVGLYENL